MNFLNLLIKLQSLFFFSLAFVVYCQGNNLQPAARPIPTEVKVSTLPSSFISENGSFITANETFILLLRGKTLAIFDGLSWENVEFPQKPIYTVAPSGQIYFAYNNTVEVFQFQPNGLLHRKKLFSNPPIAGDESISSFAVDTNDVVVFSIQNKLWRFSTEFELIDSAYHRIRIIKSLKDVFYTKDNRELRCVSDPIGSVEKMSVPENIISSLLYVIRSQDQVYAVTSGYPWINKLTGEPSQTRLFDGMSIERNAQIKKVQTGHNKLFLLFGSNEIVEAKNQDGKVTASAIETSEIADQIVDILPFSNETLLILSPTAIHSFSNMSTTGLYGGGSCSMIRPQSLAFANNLIYSGATNGLFVASYSGSPGQLRFGLVPGIDGPVKQIFSHPSGVYAVGANGLFTINGTRANLLIQVPTLSGSNQFAFVEQSDNLWFLWASDNGFFGKSLSKPLEKIRRIDFSFNLQQIEKVLSHNGHLLVKVETNHWYVKAFDDVDEPWILLDNELLMTGALSLTTNQNSQPYLKINDCLYEFDYRNSKIDNLVFCDSTSQYLPVLDSEAGLVMLRIFEPFSGIYTLWLYKSDSTTGRYEPKKPLAPLLSSEALKQVLMLPDSTLLVVTNLGIHYYKNSNVFGGKPTATINRLLLERRDKSYSIRDGYVVDDNFVGRTYMPGLRNLQVRFSSNASGGWDTSYGNAQYSSFLVGFDISWTPWTSNSMREINGLRPGSYSLMLKTRNFWGKESDITSVDFIVKPHFYETPFFIVALSVLLFLVLYSTFKWRRYSYTKVRFKLESLINTRTEELVREKEKTDNLLARVLPKETASELKEKGRVNTQRFQVVTVLFCDIEGFTRITDETNPEALIDQLDRFFLYFDSVVEKYRIEKIKTIGDAYMCAGGIPQKNRTNPVEVVLAALEMIHYMKDLVRNAEHVQDIWELRIGIDTGPVIAGVVGRNKLSYDIWGSTVNTASRMESSGEVGQINISGNTFMLVSEYFDCTYRGRMPVKNKGDIEMYFVNGIKPSLSVDQLGVVPNYDFQILLQLVRLCDLEDFILEKLEKGLPQNLYYHNLKHTVDVYTQVELIGRSENVSNEQLLLLRTAALFHDAGHMIDYSTHEEMAVKLAREILPEYYYTEKQIEVVSDLIMSTKLPPKPNNLLEEIMCDADLDYLGRTDFIPVSNMLYRELHEHGKIGTLREWNELQIKFIAKHSYFTKTARKLRNVNKQSQLDKLRSWMAEN